MPDIAPSPAPDATDSRARRVVAMHLQAVDGNPLSADEVAMFEMFEHEGWTHERRLAYILDSARRLAG